MSFSGILFIKDTKIFWKGLQNRKLINGEKQISNGLNELIKSSKLKFHSLNWNDLGNLKSYQNAIKKINPFDFSKNDEIIYFHKNKIIKYFCDKNISNNRYIRSTLNQAVFQKLTKFKEGFYTYEKIKGKTLYEFCNPEIFKKLLIFLETKLWNVRIKNNNFSKLCDNFYRVKTENRLKIFLKNFASVEKIKISNNEKLPEIHDLMNRIDWKNLSDGKQVFFHGDLQFDNIIFNFKGFKLIDWRQDFAGNIYVGDLYYDLAKLYGGLLINYKLIKENIFNYERVSTNVLNYNIYTFNNLKEYINIIESYILDKNLDLKKIKILVGIIYLNMSPLHKEPFNEILYLYSKKIIKENLNGFR